MQTDNLSRVTIKVEQLFSLLNVPYLGSVVHGASGGEDAVRIKTEANDLLFVALQGLLHFTGHRVPNLSRLIERARHDQVAERIVERHRVHHILVLLEGQKLSTSLCIPNATCPIVATSDELVTGLVKRTVRERQEMRSQHSEQFETLLLVLHLLLDEA